MTKLEKDRVIKVPMDRTHIDCRNIPSIIIEYSLTFILNPNLFDNLSSLNEINCIIRVVSYVIMPAYS